MTNQIPLNVNAPVVWIKLGGSARDFSQGNPDHLRPFALTSQTVYLISSQSKTPPRSTAI